MDQPGEENPTREERALRLLKETLHGHNRDAVLYACLSALGAAVCFLALYGFVYWLMLMINTIGEGVHGRDAQEPRHMEKIMAVLIAGSIVLLLFVRRTSIMEFLLSRPQLLLARGALEILLITPRLILAVGENLRAIRRHTEEELEVAADLLVMLTEDGPMLLYKLGQQLPDADVRDRILLTLQITQLAAIRGEFNQTRLSPSHERVVRPLTEPPAMRIHVGRTLPPENRGSRGL